MDWVLESHFSLPQISAKVLYGKHFLQQLLIPVEEQSSRYVRVTCVRTYMRVSFIYRDILLSFCVLFYLLREPFLKFPSSFFATTSFFCLSLISLSTLYPSTNPRLHYAHLLPLPSLPFPPLPCLRCDC